MDGELTTPPSRPKTYPAVTPYAKIQLAASKRAAAAARVQPKAGMACMHACTSKCIHMHTLIHSFIHLFIHSFIRSINIYIYIDVNLQKLLPFFGIVVKPQ